MKRYIHVYFLLTGFSYFSLFAKTISPVARFSDCPRFRGCKSDQPRRIGRSITPGTFQLFFGTDGWDICERRTGRRMQTTHDGRTDGRTDGGRRTADNGRCMARDSELRITDDG